MGLRKENVDLRGNLLKSELQVERPLSRQARNDQTRSNCPIRKVVVADMSGFGKAAQSHFAAKT